jgi:4-hydroxyphenylpyruvate dioxygenase
MSAFVPWDNPMQTDGFEFVEFAAPDPIGLGKLFETPGTATRTCCCTARAR